MSDKCCHGVVNCKYYDCYHGDCTFMSMGSGNPDDMPCRVHAESDYQNTVKRWRSPERKFNPFDHRGITEI